MSILFSRSVRSLRDDRGYAGLIILALAAIIIAGWLLWFFFSQVTLYESSKNFTVSPDGMLLVQFSQGSLDKIQPGQNAVYLPTAPDDTLDKSWSAVVMDTPESTNQPASTVQVYVNSPVPPASGATGEVKVAVEKVSPFMLLVRTGH